MAGIEGLNQSQMGRLEFTTPREAWGGEASDFTPLLGADDMLAYLGAECGIGKLQLVDVEYATAGRRSLDVLAETADGRRIAIENQYGVADHDHLTRGLAYAVATGARAVVVVAGGHRDEFQSVANYLNTVAGNDDEGISVWLVKVRAVRRIGDTFWSPEFVVMSEPNEWEQAHQAVRKNLLASLDEYYARCKEHAGSEWADTAKTIIDDWLARPRTVETHKSQNTVALYYDVHTKAGLSNVIQLNTSGDYTICRRYLRDHSGAISDDAALSQLDAKISDCFPSARWPAKRYYITDGDVDTAAHRRFADWLLPNILDTAAPET